MTTVLSHGISSSSLVEGAFVRRISRPSWHASSASSGVAA
jgi:hypothetical protein